MGDRMLEVTFIFGGCRTSQSIAPLIITERKKKMQAHDNEQFKPFYRHMRRMKRVRILDLNDSTLLLIQYTWYARVACWLLLQRLEWSRIHNFCYWRRGPVLCANDLRLLTARWY